MGKTVNRHIKELKNMKKYPQKLFFRGDLSLIDRTKVSIVGTRKPSNYTRVFTYNLAQALSKRGVCVVSGGAMGVDTLAHCGAREDNTIMVVANGLDIYYPSLNRELIQKIEKNGLTMSQFENGFKATNWSFVVRNEIVVALGEILIVTECDIKSGSMRSVEYALKMGKKIFVLPHRLEESLGTLKLVEEGKAEVIYNIDEFASRFGVEVDDNIVKDEFFYFCQRSPTFEECVREFGDRVYEAELEGIVEIVDGVVRLN
jgi:DNA processing protein